MHEKTWNGTQICVPQKSVEGPKKKDNEGI